MGVGEEEFEQEPYVGLEFDTSDDARIFYSNYASRVGFRIRSGQLYRSRVDGSVCNRRFVCWKEGFQISSRTGCPAFIRVKRSDSGKWVLDQFAKDHNHDLDACEENHPVNSRCKSSATTAKVVDLCCKPRIKQLDVVDNGCSSSSSIVSAKRIKPGANEGQVKIEPYVSLKFDSANEAYQYYDAYAGNVGFRVRIGQLFRSKNDGSITSRRFVCSKEGFQHPSRVGCGAFMRIKRHDNGRWIVDRYQLEHNHELEMQMKANRGSASRKFLDEINETSEKLDIAKKHNGSLIKKHRVNNIGSDWYTVLHNYFQNQQAEDVGFFYAVEVQMGCCRSLFWADGRSRAMSGCHPKSIIADHDDSILQAIAKCVYQSHTVGEFDAAWDALLSKYGLRENAWLKELYEKRENWVPLHALRLFQILDIRELPSRYILHRWTRSAEYGSVRDFESEGSSHEIKAKMVWSLREIAAKYIEFGATSFEKYKLAYEIMHEGGRKLCWQRPMSEYVLIVGSLSMRLFKSIVVKQLASAISEKGICRS
ncbi:hypothetical protein NL676_029781 [Syzygium grande]|nr:hypothetical protein NL676_029781 [Syzygium grande]